MDPSPLWSSQAPSASTACPLPPRLWGSTVAGQLRSSMPLPPPCGDSDHRRASARCPYRLGGIWTPISQKHGEWEPGTGSERPVTAQCLVYAVGGRVWGSGLLPSFHPVTAPVAAANSSTGTSSNLPRRGPPCPITQSRSRPAGAGAADAGGLWTCCIQPSALQGVKPVSLWLGQLPLPAPSPFSVSLERSHPRSRVWEK